MKAYTPAQFIIVLSSMLAALSADAMERVTSVLIFPIRLSGVTYSKVQRADMLEYLGTRMTMEKVYRVMPEAQIKRDLSAAKVMSYEDCYDEICRLDLTKALSAEKSVSVSIVREKNICRITANLFDTALEVTEAAADVETACSYDEIKNSFKKVAAQLSGTYRESVEAQSSGIVLPPASSPTLVEPTVASSSAPPPIKAETGYLSVEGTPRGARVDINGPKSFGTDGKAETSLPVRPIQVPAGEYRVLVSQQGYDPEEESVRVYADATEIVKVDLVQSTGYIQVSGSPEGARSRLECPKNFGSDFGLPAEAKSWRVKVPRGACRLTVERDGYDIYDEVFEVAGGSTVVQKVVLKRTARHPMVAPAPAPPPATAIPKPHCHKICEKFVTAVAIESARGAIYNACFNRCDSGDMPYSKCAWLAKTMADVVNCNKMPAAK